MKAVSVVLFGLLAVVGVDAQAGEIFTPDQYLAPWTSHTTRAEVRAETLNAIASHQVVVGEVGLPADTNVASGRTRAEVSQEARRALALHEIPFGEVASPGAAASSPGRTRAEVKAELLMAQMDRLNASGRDLYAN